MNVGDRGRRRAGSASPPTAAASPRRSAPRRSSCARCTARASFALDAGDARRGAPPHEADACVTTEPGVACTVQVADCLPVLLAAPDGAPSAPRTPAGAGSPAACVEATVDGAVRGGGAARRRDVGAWLGACIGPRRVRGRRRRGRRRSASAPVSGRAPLRSGRTPGKWLADLAGLARDRLAAAGVERISGGRWCTVERRVTVLLVPPRRRHRPHGRRHLDRLAAAASADAARHGRRAAARRAGVPSSVQRDAPAAARRTAGQRDQRAEPAAAGDMRLGERHQHDARRSRRWRPDTCACDSERHDADRTCDKRSMETTRRHPAKPLGRWATVEVVPA